MNTHIPISEPRTWCDGCGFATQYVDQSTGRVSDSPRAVCRICGSARPGGEAA